MSRPPWRTSPATLTAKSTTSSHLVRHPCPSIPKDDRLCLLVAGPWVILRSSSQFIASIQPLMVKLIPQPCPFLETSHFKDDRDRKEWNLL